MLIGGYSSTASVKKYSTVPHAAFVHRAPPLPLGVQRGRAALHVGRVLLALRVVLFDLALMFGLRICKFSLALGEPSLRTGERGPRVGGGGAVLRGGGDRRANVGQLRRKMPYGKSQTRITQKIIDGSERYFSTTFMKQEKTINS